MRTSTEMLNRCLETYRAALEAGRLQDARPIFLSHEGFDAYLAYRYETADTGATGPYDQLVVK